MKNLRIVNHHLTSAKNSMNPTSRGEEKSAISNRILREIIAPPQSVNTCRNNPRKIKVDVDYSLDEQENCNKANRYP